MSGKLKISVSGIRGVVGEDFDAELVSRIVSAFGRTRGGRVVLGRDTRQSGSAFEKIASGVLLSEGLDVIELGIAPTPTVELATLEFRASGGIVITASHNPPEWNGIKLIGPDGVAIEEPELSKIIELSEKPDLPCVKYNEFGRIIEFSDTPHFHIEKVLSIPYLDLDAIYRKHLRVVYDGNNGAGCVVIPRLLRDLGCEVFLINEEPNGNFTHSPEPIPDALVELGNKVRETQSILGLATDPDADRLALVDENGVPISEEFTLAFATDYLLSKNRGPVVVNLSTSSLMDFIAEKYNVPIYRTKIGELNVARGLKEHGGVIGGEGNGGVILPEIHYGRDAIVATVLILAYLTEKTKKPSQIKNEDFPAVFMIKDKLPQFRFEEFEGEITRSFNPVSVSRVDGIRLVLERGWIHIRQSNTEPITRIIVETASEEESKALLAKLKGIISGAPKTGSQKQFS